MKIKIVFFLLFVFFPFLVSSASNIDLKTSSSSVSLWEYLTLEVILTTTGSQVGDITIPGIEAFDIFSSSQSQRFQSINGETQNEFLIELQLSPKSLGDFEIWPVETQLWEEKIRSNTLKIQVWEKGNPTSSKQTLLQDTKTQTNTGDILEFRDELRVPEKGFGYFKIVAFLLWVILFFLLFFFLLRKYFLNQKTEMREETSLIPQTDFRTKIQTYFLNHTHTPKHEFYRGLNAILREYLEERGVLWAREKTYKELAQTKHISQEFLHIFRQSYIYEYDDTQEKKWEREQMQHEILQYKDLWF